MEFEKKEFGVVGWILCALFVGSGAWLFSYLIDLMLPPEPIASDPVFYVCPDEAEYRFVIPDIGVSVACYAGKGQDIVDAVDSAAMFDYYEDTIIADHNYQGFNALKKCVFGTEAFLVDSDRNVINLICIGVTKGYNTGFGFADEQYNELMEMNPGGFTCYTCDFIRGDKITMIYFQIAR